MSRVDYILAARCSAVKYFLGDKPVPKDKAGYCECHGKERVKHVACGHEPFTCEQACADGECHLLSLCPRSEGCSEGC